MATREFGTDFLHKVINEDQAGARLVENIMVEKSRWAIHYNFVFEFEGKFYESYYDIGATEYQEQDLWNGDKQRYCTEVKPVEVIKIEYVTVKD